MSVMSPLLLSLVGELLLIPFRGNQVAAGTCGLVLGPAPEEPLERLLVRFDSTLQGREGVEVPLLVTSIYDQYAI